MKFLNFEVFLDALLFDRQGDKVKHARWFPFPAQKATLKAGPSPRPDREKNYASLSFFGKVASILIVPRNLKKGSI